MEQHRTARRERGLLGGIAAIVLTGVALGIGYNALALAGKPSRGLSWIKQETVLPALEAQAVTPPPDGSAVVPSPDVAQPAIEPASEQPEAIAPTPRTAGQASPAAPAQPTGVEAPYVPDTGGPFRVGLDKAKQFFDARGALFIDARDPAEFAEGHIAGAINMPYEQVITDPDRLSAVDSGGRAIITYCGGGTCEVSISLAEALVHQAGKTKVLVFIDGYPGWAEAGYPVERGPE